jgi:hypothetical protein
LTLKELCIMLNSLDNLNQTFKGARR